MKRTLLLALFLFACSSTPRQPSGSAGLPLANPQTAEERANYEAAGPNYAIAVQGRAAALAAEKMYQQGGNIIDATVAASFAISVERPHSTGLGGGGFLLFREAKTGQVHAVDFRERAPLKAHRDMYLDAQGNVIPGRSRDGVHAVGTPGLVAGLAEIHQKWGKLPWKKTVEPAIELAEQGFAVYPALERALGLRQTALALDPEAKKIFLKADGSILRAGELLVQKDLAQTLRRIAANKKQGFYGGDAGKAMLDFFRQQGGPIEKKDFDAYRVKWRKPVQGTYQGHQIFSMPPPSSGGIHVLQILNMLEQDPLRELKPLTAQSVHRMASAMQLAFADRAVYPGDPDFVKVPVQRLISKPYAQERRASILADKARPSSEVKAGEIPLPESPETTHFSLMDKEGNAVASTQTINLYFGAAVIAPGTGVLLNDEMDDFSTKPGVANAFGALGGDANSIAPGKTPLSSMSPTIVVKDGKPVIAVGAPGGTRIITCVAQTLLNYLSFGMPAYESVASIRFHHQWMPDEIQFDSPGPGSAVVSELEKMGHKVRLQEGLVGCRVEMTVKEGGLLRAVSDPRDWGYSIAR